MAKRVGTQIPLPTGSGPLRKIIGLVTVIALFMIVIKHPTEAAATATKAARALGSVVDGLWSFVQQLG